MKRSLILLLLLLYSASLFAQQQRKAVWFVSGRPGVEGATCSTSQYPDIYIVGYNAGDTYLGNIMYCNPVDDLWDELAPKSASNRTGWYILSDDMDTADELGTQIGSEVTGTGDFVRETAAVLLGQTRATDAAGDTRVYWYCNPTYCENTMDSGGTNSEVYWIRNVGGPLKFEGCGAAGGDGPSPVCAANDHWITFVTTDLRQGNDVDEDINFTFDLSSAERTFGWDESADAYAFDWEVRVNDPNFMLGAAVADGNETITFIAHGGNETFYWDDFDERFEMSDDLDVTGNLTASNIPAGANH
jgi:hypothetical protein